MAGADTNRAASDPSDKATKEQQEFLALCIAAIEGTYSGTSTIAEKSKQRDVLEAPTSATDDAFSTAIATALQHPEQRPPRQYLPAGQNTHLATPTIVVQHVQQGSDSLTEAVVKQQESLQMLTATLRNVFPGPYTAALQSSHPELLKQSSLAIGNVSSAAPTGEIDYREHLSPKQSKSVGQTALSATASAAAPDALTETAIKHERSSDTPLATVETAAVQCAKPKFLRQFSLPIRSVSPATFRTMSQSIAHGTPKLSTLAEEDPFVKALNATKQYQLGIKPVSQAAQESKGTWDEPLAGKTCPKKKYFCCICLGGFTRPGTIQGRHFTQCARRYGNPFDLPWNTHPSCQPGSEYKVEELSAFLTQYHKENDLVPKHVSPVTRPVKRRGSGQQAAPARKRYITPHDRSEWNEEGFSHQGWTTINPPRRAMNERNAVDTETSKGCDGEDKIGEGNTGEGGETDS